MDFSLQLFSLLLVCLGGWSQTSRCVEGYYDYDPPKVVTLFLESQFRGLRKPVMVSNRCAVLSGFWNNAVVSIETGENCVIFFDDSNCSGTYVQLDKQNDFGASNLQLIGLGKKISSYKEC